jgi:hypothetical protein
MEKEKQFREIQKVYEQVMKENIPMNEQLLSIN